MPSSRRHPHSYQCRRLRDRYFPRGVRVWVHPRWFAIHRETRGGFLLHCNVVPFLSDDGYVQRRTVWTYLWEVVMKRKDLKSPALSKDHAASAELVSRWKWLGEWMTCAVWEDTKEARIAPTVTLWAQGGQWKACLRDRDRKLIMWLAAGHLSELIDLIDSVVLTQDAPWRHDEQSHERNGKRVKKTS